jgi:preprotein translocase subunit SecG
VATVSPLFIVALVVWAISAVGLIVLVLMHSGKGAGLSETFGGSMDPSIGTGMIEKNLNRITIICTLVFIATLFVMIFVWPSADYSELFGDTSGDGSAITETIDVTPDEDGNVVIDGDGATTEDDAGNDGDTSADEDL